MKTNLNEDFQIHDTLNPKLYENNQLLPEVRQKIVDIVANFEEYVEIPIHIVDIVIVGSNAAYNYTQYSDLDVHVIVNPELVQDIPEDIQTMIYNMKKSSFNKEFDIKIKGIPVELYVEDMHSSVVSNGIYSVCDDRWVKEPKQNTSVTKHNIEKDMEKWTQQIQQAIDSNNYDEIANTIDLLYLMRKNSISLEGEYGKGNEIFKTLRDRGYVAEIKEALSNAISKNLSLESYAYKGKFVSRFEE